MDFPNKETQFKPGESGNPNGRPKKLVANINAELKADGYHRITNVEVMSALETLVNLDEEKLKDIASGKDHPMLFRIAAKELLGKNGAQYMETIIDRAFGKAKQRTEITGDASAPLQIIISDKI